MANLNQNYSNLYENWKAAFPEKKGDVLQREVNFFWNQNKSDIAVVLSKIQELQAKAERKKKASTLARWVKQPSVVKQARLGHQKPTQLAPVLQKKGKPGGQPNPGSAESSHIAADSGPVSVNSRPAPSQQLTRDQINKVNEEIARMEVLKQNGFATKAERDLLQRKLKQKLQLEVALRRKQTLAENSKKFRKNVKKKVAELKEKFPELSTDIEASCATRTGAGRPRKEDECPHLLKTIVDIVAPEASADVGRRSELLRACTTLDDLKKEVEKRLDGFTISRSGLYLRLLPRNSFTKEGQRHVKTVPVKLIRAQNIQRKAHPDDHFAAAVNLYFRNLAEALGPEICLVISQDDKARVHMGLPAANKQAPVLMHLDYIVMLPDHDYVVAPGHKLIPSVYAGLNFENRKLTYSGPTYIAIRSGKHDKSTASSHAQDFRAFLTRQSFESLAKTGAGEVKPVIFIFTDGGPDENPRFPKVLEEVAKNFRLFDLDGIFVATHAPGHSAFNQVERRMAPLSRDLAGLVLPHDHYGSHLNASGKTIDAELELKNFQKAGETLAEVWSSNTIDGFPVDAEYIAPENSTSNPIGDDMDWFTEEWRAKHVRQAQYCLQIVKCSDESCCKPFRSNYNQIFPARFVPAPVLFTSSAKGPVACSTPSEKGHFGTLYERNFLQGAISYVKGNDNLPFDFYCPSVHDEIKERICNACQGYFISKKALANHKKILHKSSVASIEESINAVVEMYAPPPADKDITIIGDLAAWMSPDLVEIDE